LLAQLGSWKTEIIHRWLTAPRRAERLLEPVIDVFLASDLFAICDIINQRHRRLLQYKWRRLTSFLQHLPFSQKYRRSYLPFMQPVVEQQLCLSASDVIQSSSHAVPMSVIPGPNQLHICYVHTPPRDGWHLSAFVLVPAKAPAWVSPVVTFVKGEALECIRGRTKRSKPTSPLQNRRKSVSSQQIDHFSGMADEISRESCSQNVGRFSNAEFRKGLAAISSMGVDADAFGERFSSIFD
jgi:hypothetical protein